MWSDKIHTVRQPNRQKLDHPVHLGLRSVESTSMFDEGNRLGPLLMQKLGRADPLHAADVATVATVRLDRQRRMAKLIATNKTSPVRFAPNEQGRTELAVVEEDQDDIFRGLAVMLLEPTSSERVHIVLDCERSSVGYLKERVEGSDVLIRQSRREQDPPSGRVNETGRAQANQESLLIGQLAQKVLCNRYGVCGGRDGLGMELPKGLPAEIQATRFHVARPNGGSNDMKRAGVDGDGDPRSSGPAGLRGLFSQQVPSQKFSDLGAHRIGPELRSLMQLPPAERSLAAKNSENSALMERQDGLFTTDHDRK